MTTASISCHQASSWQHINERTEAGRGGRKVKGEGEGGWTMSRGRERGGTKMRGGWREQKEERRKGKYKESQKPGSGFGFERVQTIPPSTLFYFEKIAKVNHLNRSPETNNLSPICRIKHQQPRCGFSVGGPTMRW